MNTPGLAQKILTLIENVINLKLLQNSKYGSVKVSIILGFNHTFSEDFIGKLMKKRVTIPNIEGTGYAESISRHIIPNKYKKNLRC